MYVIQDLTLTIFVMSTLFVSFLLTYLSVCNVAQPVRKIQTHRALFGHLFFNIRCVTVHKDEREKRTEQY